MKASIPRQHVTIANLLLEDIRENEIYMSKGTPNKSKRTELINSIRLAPKLLLPNIKS